VEELIIWGIIALAALLAATLIAFNVIVTWPAYKVSRTNHRLNTLPPGSAHYSEVSQ